MSRTYSSTILAAKGIAIMAVVVGHLQLTSSALPGWDTFRSFLFSFHVATFILTSGFLYGYTQSTPKSLPDYCHLVGRKCRRLLLPYLTVTAMIILIKYWAGQYVPLQHPLDADLWRYIVLNPVGGPTTHLWFLYVLFLIFCIYPLLSHIIKQPHLMIALCLTLSLASWPTVFCLNLLFAYLPVFAVGHALTRWGIDPDKLPPRRRGVAILVLAMTYGILLYTTRTTSGMDTAPIVKLLAGQTVAIAGSMVCLLLASALHRGGLEMIMRRIGSYSPVIYLLHTIPMGATWLLLRPSTHTQTYALVTAMLITCLVGISVPILVHALILRKNELLSCFIAGKAIEATDQ